MLGLTVVARASAQAKPGAKPPATAARTTLSGIYTAAQATKGEDIYYGLCVSCHPKGTYAGPGFKSNWAGKPLSDLFDWVLTKMPKNDPGTLSPAESAQVVAYILKENSMPVGKTPLSTSFAALERITIAIK
jgi:mono/diheme cytochrome c family protein